MTTKKPKTYIAIVGLTDDKTGREWEPGATLTEGDFSKDVIANWLEIGAIAEESKPEGDK
jgi:hypothetical protein